MIGAGVAAISSEWGFLTETFAGADICYGRGPVDLADCLAQLTPEQLATSAAAITDRRALFDWEPIADQTLALLDDLVP